MFAAFIIYFAAVIIIISAQFSAYGVYKSGKKSEFCSTGLAAIKSQGA